MVEVSNAEAKLTIRIYLAVSCVLTPHTGPVPSAESLKSLDAYSAWRRTPEGEAWAKQIFAFLSIDYWRPLL
jgi:hypothetical protein